MLQHMIQTSEGFRKAGFNVFHSNLLYADYQQGFYASLSLSGSLSSFAAAFSAGIEVTYDTSPLVVPKGSIHIPEFAAELFTSVSLRVPPKLSWPSGWNPPDVSYYHLAPNNEAIDDMDADDSVESLIEADVAQEYFNVDGDGVEVTVIDSGFSRSGEYPTTLRYHPFYEEYYYSLLESRYTSYSTDGHSPEDDFEGHGTAIISNLLAVAPGIDLSVVSDTDVVEAFNLVLDEIHPDVVSCSWGWNTGTIPQVPELQSLIRQAAEQGIIVVFAAGNGPAHGWPGSEPCVVSVGGVYADDSGVLQASDYASSGKEDVFHGRKVPDVCGIVGMEPSGILIEMPTEPNSAMDLGQSMAGDETSESDGWAVASGTSSAAPAVAGLAALLKGVEPWMNVGRFKHVAMTTCTDVIAGQSASGDNATVGFDDATGAGLINVYLALKTALDYKISPDIYIGKTVPDGKYYNFYDFTGPHGPSHHIDTVGSWHYGYQFFGYCASREGTVFARSDGIHIKGWFRQYDTFPEYLRPGRRFLRAYVLSVDSEQILKTDYILDHDDGTDWVYVDTTITCSPEWGLVRLAFGRGDGWISDWQLTAEWADVEVYSYGNWDGKTIPTGKYVREGSSLASPAYMGPTFRVDTIGSSDYNYVFFGYSSDTYVPLYEGVTISVSGWFRQDDSFWESLQEGRRFLEVYILYYFGRFTWRLDYHHRILDYYDGTDWAYRHITFELPQGFQAASYHIAFGRSDAWLQDWDLTAEWCNVQIQIDYPYP